MAGFDDLTTHVMGRAPSVERPSLELVVIEGPDRGVRHVLDADISRVGTSASCAVRLTDRAVSRVHCEIVFSRDGVRITDSGSTNGTFVDGLRVRDADLVAGSTLRIGASALRVEASGKNQSIELSPLDHFGALIGESVEMRRLFATVGRIARTEATVLVRGETGTGKELLARAVHDASPRSAAPFVAVDCGAIAETLIESELFGHVRGAFSGAASDRRGLFEEANGGTVFLDEIGELPLQLQPKLLRVLETREVRRVGANTAKKIDVRVVAATNRSLASSVNEGSFREDLYYRLAVFEVELPPLRARRTDIPALARHFHTRFTGRDEPLPAAFLQALEWRAWPGNVRELRNFVERAATLGWAVESEGSLPPPAGLEALVSPDLPLEAARELFTERFERLYVSALLKKTGGNVTRAAELAGVNRRSIHRLVAKLRGTPDSEE